MRYLEDLDETREVPLVWVAQPNTRKNIIDFIRQLKPLEGHDLKKDDLTKICQRLDVWNDERILQELTLYLSRFQQQHHRSKQVRHITEICTTTKRRQRRIDYAKTQKLWAKSPGTCLRTILKDVHTKTPPPSDLLWSY